MLTIDFMPLNKQAKVERGASLLEAAHSAGITINNVCGGDGICGRCKMIVKRGEVSGATSPLLTREEIRSGVVLACQSLVESDMAVEIPGETQAADTKSADRDARRFRALRPGGEKARFAGPPLVQKTFLRLDPPTLENNMADSQRIRRAIGKKLGTPSIQVGLKILRQLPDVLRKNDFAVTAVVGMRRDVAELIDVEGGDTSKKNYAAVADIGTTTVVVHLADAASTALVDADACFNSQSVFGREPTSRIIASEKRGTAALQEKIVEDINRLVSSLALNNGVDLKNITHIVCSSNTAMTHFLLGLPSGNIRRHPYVAAGVEFPPFRAAEVGIKINPRGLLFCMPGVGGWIGGDIVAGILASGLHERKETTMLIDIGTNGEIVLGNREWMIACSASTGPALEGGGVKCGMMAETGAIEKVFIEDGALRFRTIGNARPRGICGSGILDLVAVLLETGAIDRAGKLAAGGDPGIRETGGARRYVLAGNAPEEEVYITQDDIEKIITAKAAVFAAAKILLERADLKAADVKKLFLAGGFGSYIDRRNAIRIGLLPDVPVSAIRYMGNTAIWGARAAALSCDAYNTAREISGKVTYYDLMGSPDYVEQFKRAMFLPHTDIELFPSVYL